jgi:hypothetical protein
MVRMKKLVLPCLALFLGLAAASGDDTQTFIGLVTDSKCGAKGGKVKVECAQKCLAAGAGVVIVTDSREVLTVDNPEALKGHEAQRVSVTGHVAVRHLRGTGFPSRGESRAIHVESVKNL